MAASPEYKLFTNRSYAGRPEYVASCKYLEDAAALVAFLGEGSTIRWGHSVVLWTEGREDFPAGESYDRVRDVCAKRMAEHSAKTYDKSHGRGSAAALVAGRS